MYICTCGHTHIPAHIYMRVYVGSSWYQQNKTSKKSVPERYLYWSGWWRAAFRHPPALISCAIWLHVRHSTARTSTSSLPSRWTTRLHPVTRPISSTPWTLGVSARPVLVSSECYGYSWTSCAPLAAGRVSCLLSSHAQAIFFWWAHTPVSDSCKSIRHWQVLILYTVLGSENRKHGNGISQEIMVYPTRSLCAEPWGRTSPPENTSIWTILRRILNSSARMPCYITLTRPCITKYVGVASK